MNACRVCGGELEARHTAGLCSLECRWRAGMGAGPFRNGSGRVRASAPSLPQTFEGARETRRRFERDALAAARAAHKQWRADRDAKAYAARVAAREARKAARRQYVASIADIRRAAAQRDLNVAAVEEIRKRDARMAVARAARR